MQKIVKKKYLLFVFFGAIALFNLGYILYFFRYIPPGGAVDFNTYWYSGLFIRQGISPYQGFLQNHALKIPANFLFGRHADIASINIHPGDLNVRPGNTAPFVLIMSLFSYLPLDLATTVWSIFNLILAFVIPPLILYYFKRKRLRVPKYLYPLSILVFFSLDMTSRGIIANGQNGIFILFLLLLALLMADNQKSIIAGIFLGLALSKYNLSFPVFIFFLIKKEWRILVTAITVQLLGIVLLSSITANSSPFQIFQDYFSIAIYHQLNLSGSWGINISSYMHRTIIISILSYVAITIPVGIVCFTNLKKPIKLIDEKKLDVVLLSVLLLWGLLSVYHLGYDAILAIFPLLFLFLVLENIQDDTHSIFNKKFLATISTAILLLIIPGSILRSVFSLEYASELAITIAILLLLIVNLLLLNKVSSITSKIDSSQKMPNKAFTQSANM
jgi:hypothetical protein